MPDPLPLSVVVTIVDGGRALYRCLDALAAQSRADALEVIVPFDDTVRDLEPLRARFGEFRFIALGRVPTRRPASSVRGQHELFDRRRAAGLAAATGELVAMLEDRGAPRKDWAAAFLELHTRLPHAAIGGAITNAIDRPLNWAVYLCDFGVFQPPFPAYLSARASDVNVCYKREALTAVSSAWRERYDELVVNTTLARRGYTIVVSPEPIVDQQRDDLRLALLCRERAAWGNLYADLRLAEVTRGRRVLLMCAAPLLPPLLVWRAVKGTLEKQRSLASVMRALPAVVVLVTAWTLGEWAGYLFNRVGPPRRAGDA